MMTRIKQDAKIQKFWNILRHYAYKMPYIKLAMRCPNILRKNFISTNITKTNYSVVKYIMPCTIISN